MPERYLPGCAERNVNSPVLVLGLQMLCLLYRAQLWVTCDLGKEAGPGFLSGAICVLCLFGSRRCQLMKIVLFSEGILWLLEFKIQNTSWPNVELWNKPRKRITIYMVARLFFCSWRNLSLSTCWAWLRPGVWLIFSPIQKEWPSVRILQFRFYNIKTLEQGFFPLHKGAFFEVSLSGKRENSYPLRSLH